MQPINPEPETIMQTGMRAACRRNDDDLRVTSIDYALLAAMFAVAVLGSIVTLSGSLADTVVVIATAVTAAVTTALVMVS
jgi:Flp pilus assembly pilin Flp